MFTGICVYDTCLQPFWVVACQFFCIIVLLSLAARAICLHFANITYMFCSVELRPDCMFWLQSKKEIAKGLRVMTKEENFPVLVHCMHGKDRTGLLIMLLLLLCDIEPQVPTPS